MVYFLRKMHYIPYFTDCKPHFFLRKIAFKIQVRLILEFIIKMSSVWFKIPASLKNGHIFDAMGNLSLFGNIGFICGSSAQMRRYELRGFTSSLTLSLSRLAITNPEECRAYVASLQSTVPVNLNWKWFVLLITEQYLC